MTTNLTQEHARAADPAFRAVVRAALFRVLPDVIGETTGGGGPTVPQRDKRHAWALSVLREPDYWTERASMLLAGEPQIRAVDPPASPSDGVISTRLQALINDMAGVLAGE